MNFAMFKEETFISFSRHGVFSFDAFHLVQQQNVTRGIFQLQSIMYSPTKP